MTPRPRCCLITGASGGLGRELARAFAGAGYRLVLTARDVAALDGLADELGRERVHVVGCDLADCDDVRTLEHGLRRSADRIDVAVCNAGQATGRRFLDPVEPLEAWRDMVGVNVFGTAATVRAVLPAVVAARGTLVLIGSVAGRTVQPGDFYSVTKHAVSAMAEAIRMEVATLGVQVALVQPGLMDTPMVQGERRSRPMLSPPDVAAAVVELTRRERSYDLVEMVVHPRPAPPAVKDPEDE